MARKSFDDILKEHERDKTNRTYSNTAKNMPSTNINNGKRKSFDDILSEHNKNKQINQQAYQEIQRQKQIQQNPQKSYLYAPDFQKYSSMGANIKNPSFNEATGTMSIFGWQPFAKDINNKVTYSRDNAALLAMDSHKDNRYDPKYSFMTDDEVSIYNYLLAKDGEEMADKYLKDLDKSLNERSMKRFSEETKKLSDENKVAGTSLNLGMSMFTPGAFIATAGQSAKNAITGSKDTLDPNSRAFGAVAIEQASREGLKEDTGAVGDFLIDTGLSMGQFVTKLPFGGTAALGMMGTGAAGQTSKDILDRGGTQKQAMLGGTVAGVAEVIFEKFSLDQLKGFKNLPATTLKGLLNNVLKGAFVEGSEEVGTEIVNTIADKIIMGDLSQYDISVRNYIEQGMSQKEAENKAKWDIAKNIGLSFAGGALSGGVLGAGANIIGNYQQGRTFTDTNTVQDLINEGLASEQNTQAYKSAVNLQNKLNTGQRITNIEVGLQQNANAEAISQEETIEQQNLTQQENNYIQSENQPITNNNDIRSIERVQAQPNDTKNINTIPSNLSDSKVVANQKMNTIPNENISAIRPIKATESFTKASATFTNSDVQVTVKGINSVSENGNVIVNIEDGNNSTVANLEDVTFTNPETAQVYGMASSYDSNGAKAFISGYNGSLDIDSYSKGFNQYYNGGKTNLDINAINKTSAYSSILPIQTRLQAYYAGKNDATAQIELRQKKATESKQISKQSETKLLKPSNNVSEEEAVIMTYVSKATGVKVVIDEDIEGANGYYKDGEIHISSKADNKALVVFSHELTHYMEDSSPDLWKDYRDYVINYMKSEHTEEYNKLTEHIKNLYKENGLDITDESIMNEISANATEEFLTDADAIQKLVNENRSIAEKIFDTLKRFIEVIKSKFSDYTATSTEGKLLRKNLDVLENARKLWMKALDNATDVQSESNTNVASLKDNITKFSLKDTSDVDTKRLTEENQNINDANELLKEQFVLNKNYVPDDIAIKKLANKLLKDYNSSYDKNTLEENLKSLFGYISNSETSFYDDAIEAAAGMAKRIIQTSNQLDNTFSEQYSELRKDLRTTGISLSEEAKKEIAYHYGSYNEFRKKYFGKIRFTNDGINLDSYWGELSSKYPELFDSETNELEQALRLAEALEITDPFLNNSFGMDTDALAQELALNIFNEYLKTPALHNNQMAKLRKEYDNKIKDIQKYYYNRYQEQYSKLANTTNDKLAKQKAKFVQKNAESRNTRKQREAIKKYKTRIEKNSKDLTTWITHPTDAKHVPEVLKRTVLEFLTSLDLTSNRLNNKGELTRKSIKWNDAMENLRRMLSDMETVSGEGETGSTYQDFYMDIDPELISRLDAFVGGNKQYENINNMNAEQLKEVDYLVSVVKKAVTEANKLKANAKYQTIVELGNSSIGELNSMKSRKLHSDLVNKLDKFVNLDQMDSFSYFESLGSAATTIQNELRKGHDKHTININQTLEYMNELKKDTDTSKWTGKSATVKTFNIKGKEVKMTIGQIMELYQLNKREQARGHIYGGGIKILDVIGKEEQSKGKIKIRQLKPIQLSKDDVNMVINSLSDEQKRIADGMQEFMSNQAAEWGNETSLQMYGYKKFTEENYYPIKSDDNYTITNDQNSTAGQLYAIKNLGMTKATVKNANNPLIIGDIFDTFTRHVTEMSTYNAFLIPLSDTMKWYNYKSKADGIYHGSVKEGIQSVWNDAGKSYFTNLIKDINGVSHPSYGAELFGDLVSNIKVASVGFSLSVVVQQPTAYIRAASMINPKYLLMGIFKKPQISKSMKYAPIVQWKSWGFFDINIGRSMKSIITGERNAIENIREKSLWLAGEMDNITLGTLWNAVEFEVKSKNNELQYGSEEFNKIVGERLSDIIDRTQVVDTILHRSQLMRSKQVYHKILTSFMSEPNKSYNLLKNVAFKAYNDKSSESYTNLFRTVIAVFLSGVAAGAAKSLSDAFKDKDKEEDYIHKYIESLKNNIADNVNPLNMLPGTREIVSLFNGYTPSRMDMTAITSVFNAIKDLYDLSQGTTKKSNYAIFSNTTKAISQMFGVPAGNLLREFESIYNNISEEGIEMQSDTASSKKTYKSMYEALINGDKDKYDKLLNYLVENEKTTDAIDSGLRKALIDNDQRIAEAGNARISGDTSTYKKLVNEMKSQGFKQDIVIGAINNYITSLKPKKEKPEETGYSTKDGKSDLYGYNDLLTAIENNNVSSIVEIRDIMIESGKELKSIRSQITEKYKPLYQEYYNNGDTKKAEQIKDTLISYFGYEEDTFTEWEGITTGNMAKALIDGDINKVIEIRDSKLSGLEGDEYKQKLGSLKSTLTSKVKPVYVDYYLNGEYDSMDELKVLLMDYFGYEEKTIDKWLEG